MMMMRRRMRVMMMTMMMTRRRIQAAMRMRAARKEAVGAARPVEVAWAAWAAVTAA